MNVTRRQLLTSTAALGAVAALARAQNAPAPAAAKPAPDDKTPRVLILGGTGFLGPHLVDACKARGWKLTLFNRGKSRPHLFDGDDTVETLNGDRDGGLQSLQEAVTAGRRWNAVVDDSGYVPRVVKDSATLLGPAAPQYVFISTVSVYSDTTTEHQDETGALAALPADVPEKDKESVQQFYGALKALCEGAVSAACPGKTTVVRPGLIVGPGDFSDRYTYWPVRLARGGEVLAPGDGSDPVQYIDVRDLADFVVRCIADRTLGTFNALGPDKPLATRELLAACDAAAAAEVKDRPAVTFTWVSAEFLQAQSISAWQDLPVWVPHSGDTAGFHTMKNGRAVAKGLTFRDPQTTARDTLVYWNTLPAERRAKPRAGLSAERETAALAAWHNQHAAPAGAAPEKHGG